MRGGSVSVMVRMKGYPESDEDVFVPSGFNVSYEDILNSLPRDPGSSVYLNPTQREH